MLRPHSRRSFLYASAVTAASATLTACTSGSGDAGSNESSGRKTGKGSAATPLKPPDELREAPMLAEQVEAGDLPPLRERIPARPYVLPHNWVTTGKYGGELRLVDLTQSGGGYETIREYMYGFSFLRWLNDGQDIGPGLAERWEHNEDMSRWTFHFRKGLKWSDGHPWTTKDVMFWWEDWVLDPDANQSPPDELRSAKGNVAKLSAPDDHTLVVSFDTPAPLLAQQVAAYVNGGEGNTGRVWSMPKHYLKQFHPKYNKSVGKDWSVAGGEFTSNWLFSTNPDCPTMTGWRLKKLDEGRASQWERNPYYYVVDKDGNQLPYLDGLTFSIVREARIALLEIRTGKVDFATSGLLPIALSDISTLRENSERAGTEVTLWNSGSGTGSAFFVNYDVQDPKLRKVFRNPKFRQALSHAFKRSDARKGIYYNSGEITTGTSSPGSREFHLDKKWQKRYEQWRDSYATYDPDKAKRLLDEIGMKDNDGDGWRELPDGTPFTLRIDFPADIGDADQQKDAQLERDWKAVGLEVQRNPIAPDSYGDQWASGKLMCRTPWGVANVGGNFVQPYWLVPIENARWAPLEGQYYALRGSAKEGTEEDVDPYERTPPRMAPEPDGPIDRMWKWYDKGKMEPDALAHAQAVWEIVKIHINEGPFFQGTVANEPRPVVFKTGLRNVPLKENLALGGLTEPWGHPTPAVYDPECFYWEDPGEHQQ